jgi:hypothetical protein
VSFALQSERADDGDVQIEPISNILSGQLDILSVPKLAESVLRQVDGAGWGLANNKLKGSVSSHFLLPVPRLCPRR